MCITVFNSMVIRVGLQHQLLTGKNNSKALQHRNIQPYAVLFGHHFNGAFVDTFDGEVGQNVMRFRLAGVL